MQRNHCNPYSDSGCTEIASSIISPIPFFQPNHPEHLLYSTFHIFLCSLRIHGFFQSGHLTEDWEKSVDSSFITRGSIFSDRARKGKHWLSIFLCKSGNSDGRFSHNGLAIQTTFTSDYDVCIFYLIFYADFFQDNAYTWFQFSMKKSTEGKAKASGCSAAWVVWIIIKFSQLGLESAKYSSVIFA